ncbi:MAG: LacI family DNA-binding transcriptional regulator [Vicinamibacteraceae bacterium]
MLGERGGPSLPPVDGTPASRDVVARQPRSAVGIRDIAQRLGVSVGTVDRALHDKPGVNPDTRARVLAAAQALSYRPNLAASYLRSRRSQQIAVHLPAGDSLFMQTLRDGIREGAAPFAPSLALEFRTYASAEEQALLLSPRALSGSAGLIVVPGSSKAIAARLEDVAGPTLPIATVVDAVPGRPRLLSVFADPLSVGALAGELMARFVPGRGQVAIIGSPTVSRTHAEHVRGFMASLSRLSSRLTLAAVVDSHVDERETHRRVRELLHAHPRLKGLYISTNDAVPVLRAAGHEGRLVDLVVVATDLAPELFPWIRSGKVAATIYQRPLTQGQTAVQLLHRYLQTRQLPTPCRQILAPYVVMSSNLNLMLQRLDIARAAALPHELTEAAAAVAG